MRRAGTGDIAGAWADVATLYRLSRWTVSDGGIMSTLVWTVAESLAHGIATTLIETRAIDARTARATIEVLATLRPRASLTGALRQERLYALESMAGVWRVARSGDGRQLDDDLGVMDVFAGKIDLGLDDAAFRALNRWYDRIDEAMEPADGEERIAAYEALFDEFNAAYRPLERPSLAERLVYGAAGVRTRVSRHVGEWVVREHLPDLSRVIDGERRTETRHRLLLVAIALEGYRAESGDYPETLDALAPAFLAAVPDDPFAPGTPLRYRRVDVGCELSSLGAEDGDEDDDSELILRWPQERTADGTDDR